jgi:hypothetical protein
MNVPPLAQVEAEVDRLLSISGFRGIIFLHYYLKPWVCNAIKEGYGPNVINKVINDRVDCFIANHNDEQIWVS